MNNVVIIADDLTGAADTGVQFCPFFEDTTLISYQKLEQLLDLRLAAGSQATAVYTNSRALAAEAARQYLERFPSGAYSRHAQQLIGS